MKKRRSSKKLSLGKLKIAKLSDQNKIIGGKKLETHELTCHSDLTVRPPIDNTTTVGPTQEDQPSAER